MRGIDPAAIASATERASLVEGARGETVYAEGGPATTLYFVVRGVLKLIRTLDRGRDVIVDLAGRGDVIAEAALSDDAAYDTGAVCVHPSTILALPREDVLHLIESQPEAIRTMVAWLNDCVRRAQRRVEDLAVFGVRQRIARHLLRMAEWTGRSTAGGDIVVPVALSRRELAALVGTTMETAIRIMSTLRREGLVEPGRCGIVLKDRAALAAVASG